MTAARQAISSPLLESAIDGARGILLNICGGSDLTLFEVNEAATVVHEVAHAEANIIFGTTIDDEMGDEVRITVIAAGFERWEEPKPARRAGAKSEERRGRGSDDDIPIADVFADDDDDDLEGDSDSDEFDVPSFLK